MVGEEGKVVLRTLYSMGQKKENQTATSLLHQNVYERISFSI